MHFRHFLLSALVVGAAIYLPNHAFAEKNAASEQAVSHKEMVQAKLPSENTANVSVKAENNAPKVNVPVNTKSTNAKAKMVELPEAASKSQRRGNPQLNHPVPKQVATKQTATAKSLPEQAKGNGYGLTAVKKNGTAPGQVKTAMVKESKAATTKVTTPVEAKTSTAAAVKNQDPSPKLVHRTVPEVAGSDISESKQVVGAKPIVPIVPRKGKVPSNQEKMPDADQAANPTPQRANNSGGPSNDRVSQGLHTNSYLDKWFEWNKLYEIKLVQPFLSRYALRNHQWVNAPPSPPPQIALFL